MSDLPGAMATLVNTMLKRLVAADIASPVMLKLMVVVAETLTGV